MDKELQDLAKKIAEKKADIPSMSTHKCIKHFYDDIDKLLELRTLKAIAEEFNKSGFIIKYEALKLSLSRIRKDKDKNGLKLSSKSENVKPVKSSENLKPEKKKQDIISDNQASINSESLLSPEEQAKKYFTQKPLIRNKENKS